MNSDFPRIITLLRKERNISQKKAAADLGVSQALLSHYEKGIRECGLDFLVKTADYYNVSCDYLLGRSPEPAGKQISFNDIPEHDPTKKEHVFAGGVMASFNRRLIINAINVLFSLAQKSGSDTIVKEVATFLMLAIYRMFRIIYSANPKNDQHFFTVNKTLFPGVADAAMSISEAKANAAARGVALNGGDVVSNSDMNVITTGTLSSEYSTAASSLLNVIKNSEAKIIMMNNDDNK